VYYVVSRASTITDAPEYREGWSRCDPIVCESIHGHSAGGWQAGVGTVLSVTHPGIAPAP
jgi:hypothetical protein